MHMADALLSPTVGGAFWLASGLIGLAQQHAATAVVDHALANSAAFVARYKTEGAAGLVMDIKTGEVVASASLPRIDPSRPSLSADADYIDRVASGTYELGSVFKTMTVAMALDEGLATAATVLDVRQPLVAGKYTITDMHAAGRPLSVAEVFTHSSNVGAGMLALKAGPEKMKDFMQRAGLLDPLQTELGTTGTPQLPPRFDGVELLTMSYGHGLAVAPLQFAAATASLLNGGVRVRPTFLRFRKPPPDKPQSIVSDLTSREIARLFRLNVIDQDGTGKHADVPGYRVGGKTGTAELADGGTYREKSVISSFLGAFPMDAPRYLTFVLLFEPKASLESSGQRTASMNAAPVTARLIRRIAPQLDVPPRLAEITQ